jgi:hypothetical protein
LDIAEDIDTVVAALEDQVAGSTAVVMELGQYSEAVVRLYMDQDFDPMKGMVIVLEMYLPDGKRD